MPCITGTDVSEKGEEGRSEPEERKERKRTDSSTVQVLTMPTSRQASSALFIGDMYHFGDSMNHFGDSSPGMMTKRLSPSFKNLKNMNVLQERNSPSFDNLKKMNVLQERNSISGKPTFKRSRSQIDENKKCDIQHWNLNGQIENGNLELIKPSRKIYQGEGTYQPRIDSPKRNNSKASKKNPISIGSSSSAAHYDSFPEEDIMSPIGSSSPCPFKSRCDSCASPTANNNKDFKKKTSMLPNRDAPVQLVSAQIKIADCKKEVVTHGQILADFYFDSSSDEDEDTPMSRIDQSFNRDSQKQHTDIMVPAQHPNVDDTISFHHFDKNGPSVPGSKMYNTRVGSNVPHVLHTNLYKGPQHAAEVLFKKEWQASLVAETLAREIKEDHVAAEALAMQEVEERLAAETWSLAKAIEDDLLEVEM